MAKAQPPNAQVLLDKDAIRETAYEFYYRWDEGEWAGAIDQFATEDISFDAGAFGMAEGRDEWQEWADTVWKESVAATWHMLHNPIIEVDDDEAKGRWRAEIPAVTAEGDGVWFQGVSEHEYRRMEEEWKGSCPRPAHRFQIFRPSVRFRAGHCDGALLRIQHALSGSYRRSR